MKSVLCITNNVYSQKSRRQNTGRPLYLTELRYKCVITDERMAFCNLGENTVCTEILTPITYTLERSNVKFTKFRPTDGSHIEIAGKAASLRHIC